MRSHSRVGNDQLSERYRMRRVSSSVISSSAITTKPSAVSVICLPATSMISFALTYCMP